MTQLPAARLGTRALPVTAALVMVGVLAGCGTADRPGAAATTTAPEPVVTGDPPRVVDAGLADHVVPGGDGWVSWTTTWHACFAAGDGEQEVSGWESRTVTSEGSSPEVAELPGGCLDLDVATGTNAADVGMAGRELQLSDAQALAYRVRAVREDGTVTPWTDPVRVGTVTSGS